MIQNNISENESAFDLLESKCCSQSSSNQSSVYPSTDLGISIIHI